MTPLKQVPKCHIHTSFVHQEGWFHMKAWCVGQGCSQSMKLVLRRRRQCHRARPFLQLTAVKSLETMEHVTAGHGKLQLLRDTFLLVSSVMKP